MTVQYYQESSENFIINIEHDPTPPSRRWIEKARSLLVEGGLVAAAGALCGTLLKNSAIRLTGLAGGFKAGTGAGEFLGEEVGETVGGSHATRVIKVLGTGTGGIFGGMIGSVAAREGIKFVIEQVGPFPNSLSTEIFGGVVGGIAGGVGAGGITTALMATSAIGALVINRLKGEESIGLKEIALYFKEAGAISMMKGAIIGPLAGVTAGVLSEMVQETTGAMGGALLTAGVYLAYNALEDVFHLKI